MKFQRGASIAGWVEGHPKVLYVGPPLICSAVSDQQPPVSCNFGGLNVHALIDAGSMRSFIRKDVFKGLKPHPVLFATPGNCVSSIDQPLYIAGSTVLNFSLPGMDYLQYPGKFFVSSGPLQPLQCVLGWDSITSNKLPLSCSGNGAYALIGAHGSTSLAPHLWNKFLPSRPDNNQSHPTPKLILSYLVC